MLACTGGEDYELVLVGPRAAIDATSAALAAPLQVIGEMTPDAGHGVRVLDGDGDEVSFGDEGWDHIEGPRLDIAMSEAVARESATPSATRRFGERIGRMLRAGDVVLLSGELGAGKTVLAQGIGRGLGVTDPIKSSSFVIMNEYEGPAAALPRRPLPSRRPGAGRRAGARGAGGGRRAGDRVAGARAGRAAGGAPARAPGVRDGADAADRRFVARCAVCGAGRPCWARSRGQWSVVDGQRPRRRRAGTWARPYPSDARPAR